MIKTFEQFINENYNEKPVLALDEEYGAPLFNEVSESLMSEIHNSINEGRLVLDANMIEEGLFDAIGKLFKKGADKAGAAAASNEETAELYRSGIKNVIDMPDEYQAVLDQAEFLRDEMKSAETYRKIEELCKSAEDICANLAEKEAEMYKTISDKMKAANEAVKEFTEKAIAKIKEILEVSKNKVSDAVSAVIIFCKKMAEVAKKALEKIGEGVVIAFSLPFLFAFAVYKGALKICEMLVEKVKDGAKVVKDAFVKVKNTIVGWATDMLKKAKDVLKKACDAVKDGAAAAYKAIGKTFLAIVAILGQLASDAKDAIKEAYNSFVEQGLCYESDEGVKLSQKILNLDKNNKHALGVLLNHYKDNADQKKYAEYLDRYIRNVEYSRYGAVELYNIYYNSQYYTKALGVLDLLEQHGYNSYEIEQAREHVKQKRDEYRTAE